MSFQSPTAALAVPASAKACTTPEQCVLFAISSIVRLRNKSMKLAFKKAKQTRAREARSKSNELVTVKDIEQAVVSLFGKKKGDPAEWGSTAVEALLANGTIINVNAGVDGMAPVFKSTVRLQEDAPTGITISESKKKTDKADKSKEAKDLARKQTILNRKLKKLKNVKATIRKRK